MPHYDIHHSCKLSGEQKEAFATAITSFHCRLLSTPSVFVKVAYDVTYQITYKWPMNYSRAPQSIGDTQNVYIGGRWPFSGTNWINVHLRPGPTEQKETLDTLVQEIIRTWNKLARPEKSA